MRENRPSGSEGGEPELNRAFLPLSLPSRAGRTSYEPCRDGKQEGIAKSRQNENARGENSKHRRKKRKGAQMVSYLRSCKP